MENLLWGLQMTVLGMGLVFALLALLWGLLTLVLRLDQEPAGALPAPARAASPGVDAAPNPAAAGGSVAQPEPQPEMDPELVAAILVATLAHRSMRRREAAPVMRIYWPGSLLHASRWVGAGRTRQNRTWFRRDR